MGILVKLFVLPGKFRPLIRVVRERKVSERSVYAPAVQTANDSLVVMVNHSEEICKPEFHLECTWKFSMLTHLHEKLFCLKHEEKASSCGAINTF